MSRCAPDSSRHRGARDAIEAYRLFAHVADTVAVVNALAESSASVIGHDWGSPITAACAAMRQRLPVDAPLPEWMDDAQVGELQRRGLTGPLNRYRNVDRDWADLAAFDGVTIDQAAIYIAGERDSSTGWLADAIARQSEWLPGLTGIHLLADCEHWVPQERPERV